MPPPHRRYRPIPQNDPDDLPSSSHRLQPPPLPPTATFINSTLSSLESESSTAIGPRARLRSLERLRETLNERVEHLSQALQQIRIQAAEIGSITREREGGLALGTGPTPLSFPLPAPIAPTRRRWPIQTADDSPPTPSMAQRTISTGHISREDLAILLDRASGGNASTPASSSTLTDRDLRVWEVATSSERFRTFRALTDLSNQATATPTLDYDLINGITPGRTTATPQTGRARTQYAAREIRYAVSSLTSRGRAVEQHIREAGRAINEPVNPPAPSAAAPRLYPQSPPRGRERPLSEEPPGSSRLASPVVDAESDYRYRRHTAYLHRSWLTDLPLSRGLPATNLESLRTSRPIIVRSKTPQVSPASTITPLNPDGRQLESPSTRMSSTAGATSSHSNRNLGTAATQVGPSTFRDPLDPNAPVPREQHRPTADVADRDEEVDFAEMASVTRPYRVDRAHSHANSASRDLPAGFDRLQQGFEAIRRNTPRLNYESPYPTAPGLDLSDTEMTRLAGTRTSQPVTAGVPEGTPRLSRRSPVEESDNEVARPDTPELYDISPMTSTATSPSPSPPRTLPRESHRRFTTYDGYEAAAQATAAGLSGPTPEAEPGLVYSYPRIGSTMMDLRVRDDQPAINSDSGLRRDTGITNTSPHEVRDHRLRAMRLSIIMEQFFANQREFLALYRDMQDIPEAGMRSARARLRILELEAERLRSNLVATRTILPAPAMIADASRGQYAPHLSGYGAAVPPAGRAAPTRRPFMVTSQVDGRIEISQIAQSQSQTRQVVRTVNRGVSAYELSILEGRGEAAPAATAPSVRSARRAPAQVPRHMEDLDEDEDVESDERDVLRDPVVSIAISNSNRSERLDAHLWPVQPQFEPTRRPYAGLLDLPSAG